MGKRNNHNFTYDKYLQRKMEEQARLRAVTMNGRFREKWKKVVEENRIVRLGPVAKFFFPPRWYRVAASFPLHVFEKIVKWIVIIYSVVTVGWMIWLHDRIYLFGISKTIVNSKPGYKKITISVRGKGVVEELELPV